MMRKIVKNYFFTEIQKSRNFTVLLFCKNMFIYATLSKKSFIYYFYQKNNYICIFTVKRNSVKKFEN